jgi:hypothetical protein
MRNNGVCHTPPEDANDEAGGERSILHLEPRQCEASPARLLDEKHERDGGEKVGERALQRGETPDWHTAPKERVHAGGHQLNPDWEQDRNGVPLQPDPPAHHSAQEIANARSLPDQASHKEGRQRNAKIRQHVGEAKSQ